MTTDIETEDIGEPNIENEEVAVVVLQPLNAVETSGHVMSFEALGAQSVEDGVCDGGLVFDEQDGGHSKRV